MVNGIFGIVVHESAHDGLHSRFDGGGTSCRAAVARPDGTVLGRGKSGAANILTDPNNAIISITEAAKAAYRDAGLDEAGINGASAFLGLAGANVGDLPTMCTTACPSSTPISIRMA